MSIMSKYVVSSMIVHHQRSHGERRRKQQETAEDLNESSEGIGWWRWLVAIYFLLPFTVRHLLRN
ncbi:MAG: hypothetical protein U0175_26780 [Caldilineaceae bacterium]